MQRVLKTLERVYGNPVAIEYTVNMDESGAFVVNLLQCRPLYQGRTGKRVDWSQLRLGETLFDLRDSPPWGRPATAPLPQWCGLTPEATATTPITKKAAGRRSGKNQPALPGKREGTASAYPRTSGTSSPELGIPLSFGDICNFTVVCEVSDQQAGFMPELSYGSHMFQDLVEAEIAYSAVWGNEKTVVYPPAAAGALGKPIPRPLPGVSRAAPHGPPVSNPRAGVLAGQRGEPCGLRAGEAIEGVL